jgi:hypothetical protein
MLPILACRRLGLGAGGCRAPLHPPIRSSSRHNGGMAKIEWNVQRRGRRWGDEAMDRYELTPGKVEMVNGQLFCTPSERLTMLALLLENVGADAAVRIGDPDVWRAAVAALK